MNEFEYHALGILAKKMLTQVISVEFFKIVFQNTGFTVPRLNKNQPQT